MTTFQECRNCQHNEVCAFKKEYDACCTTIYKGSYAVPDKDRLNVVDFESSKITISVTCPHFARFFGNLRGVDNREEKTGGI